MIALFTPTRDNVTAGFAYDLAQLIRADGNVVFALSQGTLLPNLRTGAARAAINNNCSHVLFIDSDMRFPPDTAKRLLAHRKSIIGANYKARTFDGWTARGLKDPSKSLSTADVIGLGVALIEMDVFLQTPLPWFDTPFDVQSGKHVGEDVYFCMKVKAHGFDIWVDQDLSRQIKHTGTVELA